MLKDFFYSLDNKMFTDLAQRTLTEDIEPVISQKFSPDDCCRLRLLLIIANFEYMIKLYQSKSYPQKMLNSISQDLALWLQQMEIDLGLWGITARLFNWFKDELNGNVKQFVRLQCNDIHYFAQERTFSEGENSIAPGDPCINLHIPASGALDIAQCLDSLREMVEFSHKFNSDFNFKAIVCYSWLLDPQLQKMLPPDSNIIKFQSLGHIYPLPEHNQDEEVCWRLWGAETARKALSERPCKTTLQKNAIDFLRNGGHFQAGCLVIFRNELPRLLNIESFC